MKTPVQFIAILLSLAPALAYGADAKVQETAVILPAVSVVEALKQDLKATVSFTGTLVAQDEILVTPQVEGLRIIEVLADEGMSVAEGQVLARLDKAALEVALAQNAAMLAKAEAGLAQAKSQIVQAEAAAVEARQNLDRGKSLNHSGNIADAALDQRVAASRSADARLVAARDGVAVAEADLASIKAQRQDLDLKLSRTEIKAPKAGTISRRSARIGQVAGGAGEALFRLVSGGRFEAEAELLETHLAQLQVGAPAEVFATGQEKMISGKVRIIPSEVDRITRLGKVRIDLDQDEKLRVGAFVRGSIELARRNGVAVPTSSLAFSRDGASLMVVEGDTAKTRVVKIGLTSGRFTEILEGVENGEKVVARAGSFLRSGDKVKPVLETKVGN